MRIVTMFGEMWARNIQNINRVPRSKFLDAKRIGEHEKDRAAEYISRKAKRK